MKRFFIPVADGSDNADRIEESMTTLGLVLRRLGFSPMAWVFKDTQGYAFDADRKQMVGVPGVELRGSEEWR
jgi:hypothetical protein